MEPSQGEVFVAATDKYVERNQQYRDLWKQDGVMGSLEHVRHKTSRVRWALELAHEDKGLFSMTDSDIAQVEDDIIDLINYAAFTLRNLKGGRWDKGED